jgi:predicted aspartyl protease
MMAKIAVVMFLGLGLTSTSAYGQPRIFSGKRVQSESASTTVRFKMREDYQVIIPVSVNELEPVNFILDTGTKTTIVDERIFREIGLRPIARMPLTTFTGTTIVDVARVDSVSVGMASATDIEVSCVDLQKAFSLDSDLYGVLGQNFMSRFSYLLDYQRQRVVLDLDGVLHRDMLGVQIPVETIEFRDYVLDDPGAVTRPPMRFLLDSGSAFPVIFERPQRGPGFEVARGVQKLSFVSAFGSRLVEAGRIGVIRIGSETIRNMSVRVTAARDNEDRSESGLLPTALFRGIYFNHREGYVILNPRY